MLKSAIATSILMQKENLPCRHPCTDCSSSHGTIAHRLHLCGDLDILVPDEDLHGA